MEILKDGHIMGLILACMLKDLFFYSSPIPAMLAVMALNYGYAAFDEYTLSVCHCVRFHSEFFDDTVDLPTDSCFDNFQTVLPPSLALDKLCYTNKERHTRVSAGT